MLIAMWALVLLSALVASLCAASDGAMLALGANDELPPPLRALYLRRERSHRALAFARVMAQLTAGIALASALSLAERSTGSAIGIGAVAALIVVGLSESYARSLGDVRGQAAVQALLPFITAVETLLAPIAALGGWFDAVLHRFLPPPPPDEEDREASAEQFRQVVASEAEVSKEQEVLLTGVFRLGQTSVREIMVPRVDMSVIDRDSPWSEVVDRIRSAEHARVPVFEGSVDNIIGILFAKDVLPTIIADAVPDDWTRMLRPAVFIPEAKTADVQLRDFQASGLHIAIVADEFGGTLGLLTIEDVLEEIVGDIRDEHDEEEPRIETDGGDRFWVSGRVTLSELSDLVGQTIEREDVSTAGGLVYELLGRVPRAGESLEFQGFRVVVERVIRRRVQRVYFERLAVDDATDDGSFPV